MQNVLHAIFHLRAASADAIPLAKKFGAQFANLSDLIYGVMHTRAKNSTLATHGMSKYGG